MTKIVKHRAPEKRVGKNARWIMHAMPETAVRQQGVPARLPIPPKEALRVSRGAVSLGEMAKWLRRFVEENPGHEQNAVFLDSADHFDMYQAASEKLGEGDAAGAKEGFEAIVKRFPGDARARLSLGFIVLGEGNAREALQITEEFQSVLAGDPRGWILRARAHVALEERDKAVPLLAEANKRFPNHPPILTELQRLGELIPVGFDPKNPADIKYATKDGYDKMILDKAKTYIQAGAPHQLLSLVDFLLSDQRPPLAVTIAQLARTRLGDDPRVLMVLGRALNAAKQHVEAEKVFRHVAEKSGETAANLSGLGRALLIQGKTEEAVACFNRALELEPNTTDAAELLILTKDSLESRIACAEELRKKYPESWVPVKMLADLTFNQGDHEAALAMHREAWERGKSDDALTMILHELGSLDRIEEAAELVTSVENLARRSAGVRWNAANLLLESGRVKPAIQLLQSMVGDGMLAVETRFAANSLLQEINANVKGRH